MLSLPPNSLSQPPPHHVEGSGLTDQGSCPPAQMQRIGPEKSPDAGSAELLVRQGPIRFSLPGTDGIASMEPRQGSKAREGSWGESAGGERREVGWTGYCPGSQRSCPDPTWLVLDFSRLPAASSPQALLRLGGTFSHLKHQSIPGRTRCKQEHSLPAGCGAGLGQGSATVTGTWHS